ncbi:glucosamine-6-phosphate deaminase [Bacillus sp. RG28]|uniref:Glucosamine-6-phosphate deaminase n=1 Tax=Gottfriedia endophytica TaxID=2820819 RepID=A0A940NPV3_9BACI|nr:glucosamine-6-phosphate deaminase [Gottfriedia endophytica]MBP0724706.1 glucosamine-6-phosphate deaminase [Gottfriedia endophytica]
MKVIEVKNAEELSMVAYEKIVDKINSKEEVTLGLATGGSPLGIYELFRINKPNTAHVTTVNLDEYVGLNENDQTSYHSYMKKQLFNHLSFKANYLPNGNTTNLNEACKAYEEIIRKNPVDLQLLGLGENGHIGFNEPGTSFTSSTHIVELTKSTRNANKIYFENEKDVPTYAVTMGIGSILKAKEIVIIAYGLKKAAAVKEMLIGQVSDGCPATALQNHPNVTVVVDEEAYTLCKKMVLQ